MPVRDSRALWEKLMLDGFQAGLSWRTILAKRPAFRSAFQGFEPTIVARFDEQDVTRLLTDSEIVRSRMKILATIQNAHAYLAMREVGEDFSKFAWSRIGGKTLPGDGTGTSTRSAAGDLISNELKARGFSFVGPVIVHAWLQASGLIDDHEIGCFRRK